MGSRAPAAAATGAGSPAAGSAASPAAAACWRRRWRRWNGSSSASSAAYSSSSPSARLLSQWVGGVGRVGWRHWWRAGGRGGHIGGAAPARAEAGPTRAAAWQAVSLLMSRALVQGWHAAQRSPKRGLKSPAHLQQLPAKAGHPFQPPRVQARPAAARRQRRRLHCRRRRCFGLAPCIRSSAVGCGGCPGRGIRAGARMGVGARARPLLACLRLRLRGGRRCCRRRRRRHLLLRRWAGRSAGRSWHARRTAAASTSCRRHCRRRWLAAAPEQVQNP